jgi:hypothetical protein
MMMNNLILRRLVLKVVKLNVALVAVMGKMVVDKDLELHV